MKMQIFRVKLWDGCIRREFNVVECSYDLLSNRFSNVYPPGYIWSIEPLGECNES